MSAEISTILMSGLVGLGVAVIGALLTHGARLIRGRQSVMEPVTTPSRSIDNRQPPGLWQSVERIMIARYKFGAVGMLVLLVGVVVLGAITKSGFQDLARAVLFMFAPGIVTFIIVRQALEKWFTQPHQNPANP